MAVITRSSTANWWKFVVVGAAVLGAVIVATSITGEVGGWMWLPMFVSMLASLATLVTGVILGIVHLIGGRGASSPS